ncbi:adenylyltransferase/cytidyltransferase family protein [Candidatus Pacearchaeota archaeon]|nr:adenylyltransferase/cytidyltransferase family protein [Candidatus Pacearchaeota archaeon]
MDENFEENKDEEQNIIVAVSGYFDPIHIGHIEYFKKSKELGDKLIVIINNDNQTMNKKGFVFMPHIERAKIIEELGCVDEIFISIDEDASVCQSLGQIKPHIFTQGGDRFNKEVPEAKVCELHNINMIDQLGRKIQSSSDLVKKSKEKIDEKQ